MVESKPNTNQTNEWAKKERKREKKNICDIKYSMAFLLQWKPQAFQIDIDR